MENKKSILKKNNKPKYNRKPNDKETLKWTEDHYKAIVLIGDDVKLISNIFRTSENSATMGIDQIIGKMSNSFGLPQEKRKSKMHPFVALTGTKNLNNFWEKEIKTGKTKLHDSLYKNFFRKFSKRIFEKELHNKEEILDTIKKAFGENENGN